MSEAWDCSTPWTRQRSSGRPSNPRPPPQHSVMRPMTPSPKTNPRHVFVSAAVVSRTHLSAGLSLVQLLTGRSGASQSRFTLLQPSRLQIPPLKSMKSKDTSCDVCASYFSCKRRRNDSAIEINGLGCVCVFFAVYSFGVYNVMPFSCVIVKFKRP